MLINHHQGESGLLTLQQNSLQLFLLLLESVSIV